MIRSLTVDDVYAAISDGKSFVLLDCRLPHEYVNGHLLDSVLISDYQLDLRMPIELPDIQQIIYVYSRHGNRSSKVCEKLLTMGYKNVYTIQGGLEEWKAKGFPIEE